MTNKPSCKFISRVTRVTDLELQLLDLIETPVFVLEPSESNTPVYVAFNAKARSIANRSIGEFLNKDAREVYPGNFGEIAYNHHCEVLALGKPKTYELTLPLGGTDRSIRTHLKPSVDEQGRVTRLVGSSQDISAEYDVRIAQASSIILNTELEEFVNLAAHDLRTPIRHVKALANMLRKDLPNLGGPQLAILNKLETVAEKAMILISDVLNHAHTTGASQSIEDFELSTLCDDIAGMIDPEGRHQIKAAETWLFADKITTQIVLRNLIDNAIRHNPDKSITLTISATNAGADNVQITVADNGTGFPDPTIAFLEGEAFRQEAGFGLLGVSRLVKTRQGTITVENAVRGSGAIIVLTLAGRVQRQPAIASHG